MCLAIFLPDEVIHYDHMEIDALVNLYFEHRIYSDQPASSFSDWLTDVFLNRAKEDKYCG